MLDRERSDREASPGRKGGYLAGMSAPRRGVLLSREVPPRELLFDLEADERFGWVTGRLEAL